MMQVTRAAFQAQASLNKQATDPTSHTLVRTFFLIDPIPLPLIFICRLLFRAPPGFALDVPEFFYD